MPSFLECSFPKNHPTEFLYGHLSVEHLFDELRVLAQMVKSIAKDATSVKTQAPAAPTVEAT